MSGCSAAWARRVRTEIYSRYPKVLVVQARAYERPREVDTDLGQVTLPGIDKPAGEAVLPLLAVRKWLKGVYDPDAPAHSLVIQYHPLGGFSFVNLSAPQ